MSFYKYPVSSFAQHGCRIVKDDDSYEDTLAERSVRTSPLVDIPAGHLLVGLVRNRLMLVHALMMGSEIAGVPLPEDGEPLNEQDVVDLATGMLENFGCDALLVRGIGKRITERTSAQEAALTSVRETKGKFWASVAGLAVSHGEVFLNAASRGDAFIGRKITQGVGILDQVSEAPRNWEVQLQSGVNPIMGWRIPAEQLVTLIQQSMDLPEIEALEQPPIVHVPEEWRERIRNGG